MPPNSTDSMAKSAPRHEHVPGGRVEPREGEVLRADHDRQQEVAEGRRDRGDEEEPHHHDAVDGEELVVGVVGEDRAVRHHQRQAQQARRHRADEEEAGDRDEVEDADPLVVRAEQPRLHRVGDVQVVLRRIDGRVRDVGVALGRVGHGRLPVLMPVDLM